MPANPVEIINILGIPALLVHEVMWIAFLSSEASSARSARDKGISWLLTSNRRFYHFVRKNRVHDSHFFFLFSFLFALDFYSFTPTLSPSPCATGRTNLHRSRKYGVTYTSASTDGSPPLGLEQKGRWLGGNNLHSFNQRHKRDPPESCGSNPCQCNMLWMDTMSMWYVLLFSRFSDDARVTILSRLLRSSLHGILRILLTTVHRQLHPICNTFSKCMIGSRRLLSDHRHCRAIFFRKKLA